jgi:hypothetical protein
MESSDVMSKQFKRVSAGIGVGAAAAMCALGVAFSAFNSAPTSSSVAKTQATLGQTVTQSKPPSQAAISEAKPSLKGPAPLPPEEQGLPG